MFGRLGHGPILVLRKKDSRGSQWLSGMKEEKIMRRQYPSRPIVAVAAVIFKGDKVLLAKRATEPSKGKWSLPGGAGELGERHLEALKREIREETGIEIQIRDLVAVIDRIVLDRQGRVKYHYVILDYWAEHVQGVAKASSDILAITWAHVKDVGSFGLSSDALAVIAKAWKMKSNNDKGANKGSAFIL